MSEARSRHIIEALTGLPDAVGVSVWRLQNARERTLHALTDLPPAALDWQASGLQNTIGTLLYHIALIETDWLYEEVLEREYPPEVQTLLPHPHRTKDGRLSPVVGVSMAEHLARLEKVRERLVETFATMTVEDFRRPRKLPQYDVTPEWVLHHLAQHEAEHRGEIMTIHTLFGASQGGA